MTYLNELSYYKLLNELNELLYEIEVYKNNLWLELLEVENELF